VTIRRLTYADLPQVIAIERRAFPAPWSLAMFVLELSKPAGVCLAAVEEKTVKGYLVCSRYDTVWHLMNVAVDPVLQGNGIGTALLTKMLEIIDGEGEHGRVSRSTLEVRRTNAAAVRLYERFGYLAAGIRRRYYQDNGEDAVIMWRTPATLQGRLDDIPAAGPVPLSK
jgi:ribosomal-protein-alanine N-acetyltransferase